VEIAAAHGCALWLDGGHNLAAGDYVARYWRGALAAPESGGLALVCGMLETKDCGGYLACFAGLTRHVATVDIPDTQASVPSARLAAMARADGADAAPAADLAEAVDRAARAAGAGGRVMICGSLYLAGAVLRENG
jgi:dihydrofolate synthase/folylpolyglutamate synthase